MPSRQLKILALKNGLASPRNCIDETPQGYVELSLPIPVQTNADTILISWGKTEDGEKNFLENIFFAVLFKVEFTAAPCQNSILTRVLYSELKFELKDSVRFVSGLKKKFTKAMLKELVVEHGTVKSIKMTLNYPLVYFQEYHETMKAMNFLMLRNFENQTAMVTTMRLQHFQQSLRTIVVFLIGICKDISAKWNFVEYPGSVFKDVQVAYNGYNHYYSVADVEEEFQPGQPKRIIEKLEKVENERTVRSASTELYNRNDLST
ncbi:hypothetical protein DAPPUDRAFT_109299 [Daphnia pulex]|uniref:Uncharacterized protein n=1 Tax=Daphnia pulex TaxID=6669 RepID=E9H2K7_DAPPU|nr:hypothetical protein DAPPUDRAFT_109299 [Daphnia pulex]|eukprot:EFX74047.1 hypothetical protein DAPPUDRAFT_109299 [Daphnia pulex]